MLSRVRPFWPLLTALTSGAMLAAARFYFQGWLGLQPCALCVQQRQWHWAVLAVSLVMLIVLRFRPGMSRWAAALIGLALLGSAGMGAYHVAVEQHWIIAQCEAGDLGGLSFDPNAVLTAPSCDQIAWSWLGISMAGYNAIISATLAVASFAVALAPERT
jgi:disulfide bond formation protein DsbB